MSLENQGASVRRLQAGALTFTAYEMGQGPLVLLIHGFPDTPFTFRHVLPALASAGFRAVAITSRGYEPSSQPTNGDYGFAALSEDVPSWIEALGETSAHVVGHDWGANVALAGTLRAPQRVKSLTLMSVPHAAGFGAVGLKSAEQIRRSWYIFFFQLRGLADYVVERNDWSFLKMLWRRWSLGWTPSKDDLDAMRQAFSQQGVKAAALEYYRAALNTKAARYTEGVELLGKPVQVPVLGLTGERDRCISADIFEKSMLPELFANGHEVARIKDAGHFLHLEQPCKVHAKLIVFLRRHSAIERSS
jgi:pimeloyl-ACP methyl ester carboxylesterase